LTAHPIASWFERGVAALLCQHFQAFFQEIANDSLVMAGLVPAIHAFLAAAAFAAAKAGLALMTPREERGREICRIAMTY